MATTTTVKFTPLYGVAGTMDALCYVLEVDEWTCLLDCGWNESFDVALLEPLRAWVKKGVDAVVLTHADLAHIGALAYAVREFGLSCPMFATAPVARLGKLCLYDAIGARKEGEDFTLFTLDDVDAAFRMVSPTRYSENRALDGKAQGITLRPLPAGHTIGGAVWVVNKEEESIVYAVDWNNRKEVHLDASLLGVVKRPSVLITDANWAQVRPQKQSEVTGTLLRKMVVPTLRGGGNVLFPCDTAGRVLELLVLLDAAWANTPDLRERYPVVLLHNCARNMVEFAANHIGFLSEKTRRAIEERAKRSREAGGLFDVVQAAHTRAEMEKIKGTKPMVLLTTFPSLETGLARGLFTALAKRKGDASRAANHVIWTGRVPEGSLASKIIVAASGGKTGTLDVVLRTSEPLVGEELERHSARVAAEQAERKRAFEEEARRTAERQAAEAQAKLGDGLLGTDGLTDDSKLTVLQTAFNTSSEFLMYPHTTQPKMWDAYGQHIDPADPHSLLSQLLAKAQKTAEYGDDAVTAGGMDVDPVDSAAPFVDAEGEIPRKYLQETVSVAINCKVSTIDMEGRSDAGSVKNIIKAVEPHRLVLVHGPQGKMAELRQYCTKSTHLGDKAVFTPRRNESVDLTSGTNVYRATVKDQLLSSLSFQRVGEYEVAWVEANVYTPSPGDGDETEAEADGTNADATAMDVDDPTAQSRQKADHGDEESHVADTHSWRKGTPDMMFNRMYASLGGSQGRVLFVRIDCTEASACTAELPDADTDSAFPVFRMYFSADIKYDYDRVMNYKNLLSFVLSMAYAEVHEYTTLEDAVDNIDTLRTADRVVVGFFATDDDANYKTWIRTANTWCADVDTAEVISADIAAAFGVTQLPAIMLMKRHQLERMAIPAGGALLAADLHRFFHRASHEHVAPLKSNTFSHIQLFNTPAVLLVLDPSLAMHDEMVARINAIADNEHYQHNYKFVEVDVTRHKSLAHQLGLAENLPRIAILDSTPTLDQYTHPDSGDSAIESLERFLEDFEHGKLTMAPAEPVPDLPPIPPKSSAPFELDRKLPVQEISRSQWDEVIVNSEYDIFIEFYYPWCGHCKALEPTFQQVGQFFGRTSDVMVAKMNMQDNEPPKELNIVGAPTLMLFTAGNKTQPLTYEGKRDYKKIRKWIVANLHPDNKFLQNPPPELEDVFDLDPRAKVFIDRIRDDVAHHGYAFPPVVLEDSNDAAKDEL